MICCSCSVVRFGIGGGVVSGGGIDKEAIVFLLVGPLLVSSDSVDCPSLSDVGLTALDCCIDSSRASINPSRLNSASSMLISRSIGV